MLVHIRELTRSPQVARVLREHGWDVAQESADELVATHPEVKDQPAARARLWRLGLLTSPRLRIEFGTTHPPACPRVGVGSSRIPHARSTGASHSRRSMVSTLSDPGTRRDVPVAHRPPR
jgi:hypothetical protein